MRAAQSFFPQGRRACRYDILFHRITTPNCAEPASTDAPLLCKSPPIGSFRRYPRASPEKGSLLPLVSVSRKDRKAHPVMRPYFYFRTFHLTTLLRRSVRTTAPAILSKLRTVSGSAHQHSSPTAEKTPSDCRVNGTVAGMEIHEQTAISIARTPVKTISLALLPEFMVIF